MYAKLPWQPEQPAKLNHLQDGWTMKPVLFSFDILGKHMDVVSYVLFNLILNPTVFILLGVFFLTRNGLSLRNAVFSVSLITITALLGSRVVHVALSYKHYLEAGVSPFSLSGGFTMFGGFITAVPVIIYLCRRYNLEGWRFLDAICPGWALGIFLNKIGCFLNGCCFGIPTYVPWGVVYPEGSLPHYHYYSVELSKIAVAAGGILPYRIHPVQLYESAIGLLGFVLLLIIYKRNTTAGLSFSVFAVLYSFSRIVLNGFRAVPSNLSVGSEMVLLLYGCAFCGALAVFTNRMLQALKEKQAKNKIKSKGSELRVQ